MSRHGPGNAFRQNVPSVLSGADSNPGACLLIRRLPPRSKQLVTDLIALTIY